MSGTALPVDEAFTVCHIPANLTPLQRLESQTQVLDTLIEWSKRRNDLCTTIEQWHGEDIAGLQQALNERDKYHEALAKLTESISLVNLYDQTSRAHNEDMHRLWNDIHLTSALAEEEALSQVHTQAGGEDNGFRIMQNLRRKRVEFEEGEGHARSILVDREQARILIGRVQEEITTERAREALVASRGPIAWLFPVTW